MENEKKVRQYRSRQGRSDRQYESTMKVMGYGCVTLLGMLVVVGLFNFIYPMIY